MSSEPTQYIRPATPADALALSRICLLTGDAGQSAEHLHNRPELLGLVYALPYVSPALASVTGGYVLAERPPSSDSSPSSETILGYVLFACPTRTFEALAEAHYWPPLRSRYPYPPPATDEDNALTEKDLHFHKLIHNTDTMWAAHPGALAFSPAHLHIDLLPAAQRKGWGRRLIGRVVDHFRASSRSVNGVWVGLDPRNENARRFYAKLGFAPISGAPDNCMGLRFADWAE
ncbi:hypothetical protein PUNSTDRAFT_65223 [Punctularia strigosozonata HHB-11173 SS5]|uniref:uncharacterized protein n=1 Tax=Punctularia strigosozonata (strain HHB-11173) TaxID=741275 RepID=UPI0004417902|nr:uncharacterized protein PUNSTDRAFT_65223 [Punctularia strigosozonata HHB-11173 SS5]EIN10321.1 hypothetical protein PUNSTDRAFT_65223 [Punctularia strigosozonata HHB-11173 SS5]